MYSNGMSGASGGDEVVPPSVSVQVSSANPGAQEPSYCHGFRGRHLPTRPSWHSGAQLMVTRSVESLYDSLNDPINFT
ncbi:hypothetical protein Pmani_009249 [Petrolisthes manimaculis]|uniref:Uncharacterized protein n=1 Tax=Petrolisthes manimaculis TaxID=1843537 RepID=A0AAE1UD32_9EUCA|nr:hypothetical protein Pmani_009249 [Petrolisthes manimaculis]